MWEEVFTADETEITEGSVQNLQTRSLMWAGSGSTIDRTPVLMVLPLSQLRAYQHVATSSSYMILASGQVVKWAYGPCPMVIADQTSTGSSQYANLLF